MKALKRMTMGAAAAALLMLVAAPASALCPNADALNVAELVVTNPTFYAACGNVFGCYGAANGLPGDGSQPAVSANAQLFYWAAGSGDPINNGCGDTTCGDDDGGNALNALVRRGTDANFPGGFYYYTTFFTTTWSAAAAPSDGCPDAPKSECTCWLAVDEIANVGTVALHAAAKDGTTGAYPLPSVSVSAAIPAPQIITSARLVPGAGNVELQVSLADFLTGNALAYSNPGGNCGPCADISYVLFETIGPRPGSVAPTTRDIGAAGSSPTNTQWTQMVYGPSGSSPGNPMAPTPLGTAAYVESLCDPSQSTQTDVWVAAQVSLDSGFETFVVGSDAVKVECGPALNDDDLNVDPQLRPRPRPRPGSDIDRKPTRRDTGSRR